MKKLKLVMIGNGMAGVRTLEELLKLSSDLYDITAVSYTHLTLPTSGLV